MKVFVVFLFGLVVGAYLGRLLPNMYAQAVFVDVGGK